jgi:large subunit ribosomal protein L31e
MAKKKLIVKASKEELDKEEAKRIASKRVVKERERGKKLKKEAGEKVVKETKVEAKEEVVKEPKKKVAKKKVKEAAEGSEESLETEKLSIDEVVEEVEAFKEEAPSELEKDMIAAENKFEEEIQEERIYTVPLAKLWGNTFKGKKTKKAMKCLHEFVTQHMKPEVIYIDPEVNRRLWENGIRNPPRKLRIRVTKSTEGLVRVYLA